LFDQKESMPMSATLLIAPAQEPVSLDEAKSFLRIEHDADDAVIAALISAARSQIEAMTRRALMTQTWRFVCDRWPADGRFKLNTGPLRALTAVRMYDAAGVAASIATTDFVVDAANAVIVGPRGTLSPPGRVSAGIEYDVVLGFGDEAADVPAGLRQALRMLVAHWYENRGLVAIGQSVAMMPSTVTALIGAHRVLSL
jgi:uncharacterized phiE125 gp8 family phage protein